ncbi:MAG: S-adenosylmethionine:tRNA ribosyltransferase-isomerase [Bacteroidetes bacterium]|nr:S-adenosylmethionine:tRNA ribosyltransferase-isomerase [Bacteroidota bacterium]
MNPKEISIDSFTYDLDPKKIAQYPLDKRDESKLLVYQDEGIRDYLFYEIPNLLPKGSLLVTNNTKVIQARIVFRKDSGAKIEIFCLEPYKNSYEKIFNARETCEWVCMVGNAKRWKGEALLKSILIAGKNIQLEAKILHKEEDKFTIKFNWSGNEISFGELLTNGGILPIPPYLNRDTEETDKDQYQTTYAKKEGSVAAPTAGLHFTPQTFEKMRLMGIETTELTLHVGAGTFRPVKAIKMEDHEMHRERIYVSLESLKAIQQALEEGRPVIAVGTTSLRSLESLYWIGVKIIVGKIIGEEIDVLQWDPYELPQHFNPIEAIEAVIKHILDNNKQELDGTTQLLIAPGYNFKITNALVTNFHQPGSTLLLLVAAFIGKDWIAVYNHAVTNDYRFLSFGDASLLFRN